MVLMYANFLSFLRRKVMKKNRNHQINGGVACEKKLRSCLLPCPIWAELKFEPGDLVLVIAMSIGISIYMFSPVMV